MGISIRFGIFFRDFHGFASVFGKIDFGLQNVCF